MVAKMLLLAAAVSAYVATASAVPTPPVYAEADQVTRAYPDENYAESTTEAESEGALNEAYADAEGFAGYTEGETLFPPISYVGNFGAAKTVAESTGVDSDTESNADSDARSNGASAAEALAESESLTSGEGIGDAGARAVGFARGNAFAGAETLAEALAADDANAVAISDAEAYEGTSFTDATAEAESGDDATSLASAFSESKAEDAEDFASADADAYSEAGQLFDIGFAGGDADASGYAGAFNDEDAQATASAKSKATRDSFGAAGTTTNRATSRAGGATAGP